MSAAEPTRIGLPAAGVERRPGWDEGLAGNVKPSRVLGWLRALGIVVWTLWVTAINLPKALRGTGMPAAVTKKWHRNVLRLAGVKVTVTGQPVLDRPTLMVSNHASYLDIVALGAILPCSFVAKSEVRGWPAFGWLAIQQRTVFIERDPRKAARHLDEMKSRLAEGGCVVLFPEGTSSDGTRVLPFKSTLFQTATIEFPDTGEIEVQPISIAYTRLDGIPLGRAFRPFYTWYGDMDLAPHLIDWLGLGKLEIELVFHEPRRIGEAGGRKALASATWQASSLGLQSALRGRPEAMPTPSANRP